LERGTLQAVFLSAGTSVDAALFADVEALRWRSPTEGFDAWAAKIGDARLLTRSRSAAATGKALEDAVD
jgi:hypothetical protein